MRNPIRSVAAAFVPVRGATPVTDRSPDQNRPPQLLKTSEVARLLGVTRSTVLSWAYRGLLDYATTPGGQLRFYRDQVEAILAAGGDSGGNGDAGN